MAFGYVGREQRSTVAKVALAGISLITCSAALHAQTANAQSVSVQSPSAVRISVPAGPLESAILSLGRQTNLRMLYPSHLTAGKRTAGVGGQLTPQEAVTRLLAGTGLQASFMGAGNVRIFDPTAAAANAQQAEGGVHLDPIEVSGQNTDGYIARRGTTGTKTNTPLIETPRSISVITRDQMEVQKAQNVQEALRYTPGVFAESSGVQPLSDNFYIRGFFQGSANPNIFQDGMLRLSAPIETYGLESIEVLRGPASVMYGQNSPGGLVNLVSKKASTTPVREVLVQGGNFDRKQAAFDLGGAANPEGTVAARLTGLIRDSSTQIDFSKNDRQFLSGSVLWRPTSQTSVTLLADYQKDDVTFFYGYPAAGTVLPNPNGQIPTTRFLGEPGFDKNVFERTTVGYQAEHQFSNEWTVRQNLRYGHLDAEMNQVSNAGFLANQQRIIKRSVSLRPQVTDLFTVDNQVQRKFATGSVQHTVLAGLDYRQSWIDAMTRGGTAPALDLYSPTYGGGVTVGAVTASTYQQNKQLGLYVQDQMKFAEKLVVTVAGRQDWSSVDTQNRLTNLSTTMHDRAFTGQVGAVYLTDFGIAPYASYATSFLPVSGTAFGSVPFKPETGEQVEIGVKYEPKSLDLTATLSLFDLTRQNVTTPDPLHTGFNIQTGEVSSRGLEANVTVRPMAGINVIASYTYTDAEVTKSNTTDLGKRPFRVPAHLASIWADYTIQSGALSGVGFGGGIRHVGPSAGDQANTFDVPAYTLVDAMLRYEVGNYRFAINATNIFDKHYVAACFSAANGCNYGQARTILGTVTYKW